MLVFPMSEDCNTQMKLLVHQLKQMCVNGIKLSRLIIGHIDVGALCWWVCGESVHYVVVLWRHKMLTKVLSKLGTFDRLKY
jgi:hypothetical protein